MRKSICIFGDSIAWGTGDAEQGGWCDQLKRDLLAIPDSYIKVYNCGISGENTDKLVRHFQSEAAAREPDVIIFAIGINDSQYVGSKNNPRVPLERFESNLMELIKEAHELTTKIAFIGLTRVDEKITKPLLWDKEKFYDNETIAEYNVVIQRICEREHLPFLDLTDVLNVADLEDGLHPNANGHQKILEKAREFLKFNGF